MAKPNFKNLLNELLGLFSTSISFDSGKGHRIFGAGSENAISLYGEAVSKFAVGVETILDKYLSSKNTLSKKTLEDVLIPHFRSKILGGDVFSEADASQIMFEISEYTLVSYRVFREIYGVSLQSVNPVNLGPFTIFNRILHSKQLNLGDQYTKLASLTQVKKESNFQVLCVVQAKDAIKALEVADDLFYRFELLFRFMLGRRTEHYEVGILNYSGAQLRDYLIASEKGFEEGSGWRGPLQTINLSEPFFSNPVEQLQNLWGLVGKPSSDLDAHVLRCAEWIGQSLADPNSASAFVKAAIALEVLFSLSGKGVITSSIQAQIAESCSQILGKSSDNALEIESEVKRLYGIRSAVVHSGKDSVVPADLESFIIVGREVVLALLGKKYYGKFTSLSDLLNSLKKAKYLSLDGE